MYYNVLSLIYTPCASWFPRTAHVASLVCMNFTHAFWFAQAHMFFPHIVCFISVHSGLAYIRVIRTVLLKGNVALAARRALALDSSLQACN